VRCFLIGAAGAGESVRPRRLCRPLWESPDELRSTCVRPGASSGPSTSPLERHAKHRERFLRTKASSCSLLPLLALLVGSSCARSLLAFGRKRLRVRPLFARGREFLAACLGRASSAVQFAKPLPRAQSGFVSRCALTIVRTDRETPQGGRMPRSERTSRMKRPDDFRAAVQLHR